MSNTGATNRSGMFLQNLGILWDWALGEKPPQNEALLTHFDSRILGIKARQYIEESGIDPVRITRYLENASETEDETVRELPESLRPSKLFVHLARGNTLKWFATGKECELKAWILSHEDRMVYPAVLFNAAYAMNGGDVFNALLTIENVLTESRSDPARDQTELGAKLLYLGNLNDHKGDNVGPYYHFFGTALLAYAKGDASTAKFSAYADELPSFGMEKLDIHEAVAGVEGSKFGQDLATLPQKRRLDEVALEQSFSTAVWPKDDPFMMQSGGSDSTPFDWCVVIEPPLIRRADAYRMSTPNPYENSQMQYDRR